MRQNARSRSLRLALRFALRFAIFILALLSCGFLTACGGGQTPEGTPDGKNALFLFGIGGSIMGTVYEANPASSIRAGDPGISAAIKPTAGVEVFFEENPEIRTTTDSKGNFSFQDIVLEKPYHLVAKGKSGEALLRGRSEPFSLTANTQEKTVGIPMSQAEKNLTLIIENEFGGPLPGATVKIWGEAFSADSHGFLTVRMPPTRAEAEFSAKGYHRGTSIISFFSESQDALEIRLQRSSGTNRSPEVNLLSPQGRSVLRGGTMSFSAQAYDFNGDPVLYDWFADSGSISSFTFSDSRISWIAPALSGVASIGVVVSDERGGKSGASIQIRVL